MFLQIGYIALNTNHIEAVFFKEASVRVYMTTYEEERCTNYSFVGKDHEDFLHWWDNEAPVHKA